MALDPKTKETVREEALRLSKEFAALDGRRPRVLLIDCLLYTSDAADEL